jgi:hypothetical protein
MAFVQFEVIGGEAERAEFLGLFVLDMFFIVI